MKHISPRIRSQGWLQMTTLYVRNSADATCVTIILANNNKYCLLPALQRHQLRFSLLVLHHQEQSQ
jgi:hypothetical protein